MLSQSSPPVCYLICETVTLSGGRSGFKGTSDKDQEAVLNCLYFNARSLINKIDFFEAMDSKFAIQLGFAKAHHKTTPRGKVGVASG